MKTFALFGDPVSHSLSPLFQNAALRAAGVDAEYVALRVPAAQLPAALDRVRRGELAGANVTIPHKTAAAALVDRLTEPAAATGAVNWLGRDAEGRLVGDNTDVEGFRRALADAGIGVRERRVVLFGAGGAARAAAFALAADGAAEVRVAARRADRAKSLVDDLRPRVLPTAVGANYRVLATTTLAAARVEAATADLLVSAVPPEAWHEIAPASLRADAWLVDLAYAPAGTPAQRWASGRGVRAMGGSSMLLHQGALSFERWLGVPFPMGAARLAIDGAGGRGHS